MLCAITEGEKRRIKKKEKAIRCSTVKGGRTAASDHMTFLFNVHD